MNLNQTFTVFVGRDQNFVEGSRSLPQNYLYLEKPEWVGDRGIFEGHEEMTGIDRFSPIEFLKPEEIEIGEIYEITVKVKENKNGEFTLEKSPIPSSSFVNLKSSDVEEMFCRRILEKVLKTKIVVKKLPIKIDIIKKNEKRIEENHV